MEQEEEGKKHDRQPGQQPPGDSDLGRKLTLAAVQGLAREALAILLREVWRTGPWLR
jgi:hypothetical protein